MTFSIVIPFFNEEKNINILIDEIIKNLSNHNFTYEIIAVDDCSTDETNKVLQKITHNSQLEISIIKNISNLGQSKSILNGVKASKYNAIVTLDGDGQNNPADIPKLVNKYFKLKKYSLIGGIRAKRKDSFLKRISSRIANNVRSLILNDNCSDTGCSLKIFDKNIFLSFPFFDGIHRFLPALFTGYKLKTMFINVDHRPRRFGYSKYGTIKRLIKGIIDIYRVIKIIKKYKITNV